MELLPSKIWNNFYKKAESDTTPVALWKERHLLYYFCRKYQEFYGYRFLCNFAQPPTKSNEMYLIRKITLNSGSSNPKVWKEYIDWVFETKLKGKGIKLTSLGFFVTKGFNNQFQAYRAEQNKITRSTPLPKEYVEISSSVGVPLQTYGDVLFALQSIESLKGKSQVYIEPYIKLQDEFLRNGFDFDLVKDIK